MRRGTIGVVLALMVVGLLGCATMGALGKKIDNAMLGKGAGADGPQLKEPGDSAANGLAESLAAILGSTTLGSAGIGFYKSVKKNKELSHKQEMKQAYVRIIQEIRNRVPDAKAAMDDVVSNVLAKSDMKLAEYQSGVQSDKAAANITKPKG